MKGRRSIMNLITSHENGKCSKLPSDSAAVCLLSGRSFSINVVYVIARFAFSCITQQQIGNNKSQNSVVCIRGEEKNTELPGTVIFEERDQYFERSWKSGPHSSWWPRKSVRHLVSSFSQPKCHQNSHCTQHFHSKLDGVVQKYRFVHFIHSSSLFSRKIAFLNRSRTVQWSENGTDGNSI